MLTLLLKQPPNKQKRTHLYKVHVYSVKLQPLAFVEERNLGLRWAFSPERRHNCQLEAATSGRILWKAKLCSRMTTGPENSKVLLEIRQCDILAASVSQRGRI